jgi:transmembrane sensor
MSDEPLSLSSLRAMTPTQGAARWIAIEDRDDALFKEWLADREENSAAWQRAQAVWGLLESGEDDPMIAAMARAARQSGPEIENEAETLPEPANDRSWPKWMAAAVALFVVASSATIGMQGRWFGTDGPATTIASADQGDPMKRYGKADYVTGEGQKSMIDLPDGTRVTLASNSAIDVAFADGHRNLRLMRGHGFFDVAHDPAHPFAVEAAGRTVTALGTRFDVSLEPGRMRVVLAQGRVSVASTPVGGVAQPTVVLQPGQAFAAADGKPGAVANTDLNQDLAWRDGLVAFNDRPLSEVIAVINRSVRAQVFTKEPRVAAMRVTGQFKTGDIERFGREIELVLPVRLVARGPDRYELISRR